MLLRQTASVAPQHRRDLATLHLQQGSSAALKLAASRAGRAERKQHVTRARADEDEPDWDKEMSIFKQRTM
jgi:hypothetical protein